MEEKFVIKVRCPNCGFEDILATKEDKSVPALFDSTDDAFQHISHLSRRTFKADNVASISSETTYECPKCGAIHPMHRLTTNVFRYQQKSL